MERARHAIARNSSAEMLSLALTIIVYGLQRRERRTKVRRKGAFLRWRTAAHFVSAVLRFRLSSVSAMPLRSVSSRRGAAAAPAPVSWSLEDADGGNSIDEQ